MLPALPPCVTTSYVITLAFLGPGYAKKEKKKKGGQKKRNPH